jgi:isocitrate dehydrogenase kinase/phosphatase
MTKNRNHRITSEMSLRKYQQTQQQIAESSHDGKGRDSDFQSYQIILFDISSFQQKIMRLVTQHV